MTFVLTEHPVVRKARKEGRTVLTEVESKRLLGDAGISVIETVLAASREEAVAAAHRLGFPVALKIASPDIIHKSDSGGIWLGLETTEQVAAAYHEIIKNATLKNPEATIRGVSVQKMSRPGTEVIIGMKKDAQFGPVLMFGLGGVWVELLQDVSLRITPITRRDAAEMIAEIKGYPLLDGYRGAEKVDKTRLEDMLLALSDFVEENPGIREMDLNPVIAYSDGAVAVDARIILEEATPGER